MRKILCTLLCCFYVVFLTSAKKTESTLSEYIKCVENGEDPVEYIFRLFETSDIVILGERDHREMTQYEFITKLIADPRFAERIGYVYTEVGVTNMTQRANELIKGEYLSEEDYKKARLNYLRDEDYLFCWEKTNRSVFIDSLYHINSRLPDNQKITLGLTDVEFDWHKAISPAKYRKWYYKYTVADPDKKQTMRDKLMARNFIREYKRQKPINGCKKALLITNQPHATNNEYNKNEGFLIKKEFGNDKVKIVCLNDYYVLSASGATEELVDDGKWDAAFELTKRKSAAFDIQDTPFGRTVYSNGWTTYTGKSWQEYADGIIYYEPFYNFKCSIGIDGFVDDSCKEEHIRRLNLLYDAGIISNHNYEAIKNYYNTVRTVPGVATDVLDKMKEQMKKHITLYESH